jgi:nucleoside-diphosphate-sugar epimerase
VPKVGLLGSNGQVGAELCLLLARRPEIELVPICRNPTGSAFLRYCGIPCRHGRPAEPHDAPRLLGDCDVVVNSALASGTPRKMRRIEDQLIHNAFAFSKPGAIIIHFSTQRVYGDPRPGRLIRWLDPYGKAKLASERTVRREQHRSGKPTFVLRLGHVCGELQNISQEIRRGLSYRTVVLSQRDAISDTVYTVAIVDAILKIIGGTESTGTFDLTNSPEWTWRQVYEQEARLCGVPFEPVTAQCEVPRSPLGSVKRVAVKVAGELAAMTAARHLGARALAYAPEAVNARAQAWWYCKRARAEIASLPPPPAPPEHLSWIANRRSFLRSLTPTIELLRDSPYRDLTRTGREPWPADLPDATMPAARCLRTSEAITSLEQKPSVIE